jgi:hypothetical protein
MAVFAAKDGIKAFDDKAGGMFLQDDTANMG